MTPHASILTWQRHIQGLYVILDPAQCHPDVSWQRVCTDVLRAGVKVVQLRDKRSDTRTLIERARALTAMCQEANACCIINDRVDVALASGAHGVHVGPNDMPIEDVLRVAPHLFVGASAKSASMAQALSQQGAHYLGCGAVFEARASKPDASAPQGLDLVREVARVIDIPFVGIGGITHENAQHVVRAGASGVAVIRAVVGQRSPFDAASSLMALL